ncbi:hypothetical protein RB598_002616 [Gaeumannomyces tritici]
MPDPSPVAVVDVRFEHHRPGDARGVDETAPRLSWRFANAPTGFCQEEYEIQLSRTTLADGITTELGSVRVESPESQLVPWPLKPDGTAVAGSRQTISARVRARPKGRASEWTAWSEPSWFETGLLSRDEWATASLISAPWAGNDPATPLPEDLFRKTFTLGSPEAAATIKSARLYITSQGVYEAEINGRRVGDYVLAPGWQVYYDALAYQTYDVTEHLQAGANCIGVRVAEGWFKGRLGFGGGKRNVYGDRTALLAQLEVTMADGSTVTVATDKTWLTTRGPARLAEIYNGEKYDATAEIDGWSSAADLKTEGWASVDVLPPLPDSVHLRRGSSEPVRRLQTIKPVAKITTPSGKTVLDFGQNLVGFLRVGLRGSRGHSILLSHAEVLEKGELGTRPLRGAEQQDRYTLRGDEAGETYEPRLTFHGFRYAQVDDWPAESGDLEASIEAIVCHTDMEPRGSFACSDDRLCRLFENTRWSMRGNFLSIPTDCPQREERLGWTGDLAVFAPTANFLYGSFGMLRDWLAGVRADQKNYKGVPPLVSPDIWRNGEHPKEFGRGLPWAIWNDVVVLAPWAMWEATGDIRILEEQYISIKDWLAVIPRDNESTHLWDRDRQQLGDWLDPESPPDNPAKAQTDAVLVANAFLIHSLDYTAKIAALLGRDADADAYRAEAQSARAEFAAKYYVAANGRMTSDAQTAYALAVCFDLLPKAEEPRLAARLAELVRRNGFRVGTGFAGTPFVCEALARRQQQGDKGGHADVALSMLLCDRNPSWLYPVSMGATTIWERWDSMLEDGSINPGEMTSFNHYAYGAVVAFMVERLAGLRRLEPGWRRARAEPVLLFAGPGAVSWARADHLTPYGKVACAWRLEGEAEAGLTLAVDVVVPPTTEMEVALPGESGETDVKLVGSGEWSFRVPFKPQFKWPVGSE